MWGIARKHFYFTIGSYFVTSKPSMQGRTEYAGGIKRGSYWTTSPDYGSVTLSGTSRPAGSNANVTIYDRNGANLRNGDPVVIKNVNGLYWTATNGGGGSVVSDATSASTNQTFTIVKIADTSQMIAHGDQFALRAPNGMYLSVGSFGGNVTATASTIGTYERFTLDRTRYD